MHLTSTNGERYESAPNSWKPETMHENVLMMLLVYFKDHRVSLISLSNLQKSLPVFFDLLKKQGISIEGLHWNSITRKYPEVDRIFEHMTQLTFLCQRSGSDRDLFEPAFDDEEVASLKRLIGQEVTSKVNAVAPIVLDQYLSQNRPLAI